MKSFKQFVTELIQHANVIKQKDDELQRGSVEGRKKLQAQQASNLKKSQERDAAWWKAQDDAHKSGKDHFEFDGKKYPLNGK